MLLGEGEVSRPGTRLLARDTLVSSPWRGPQMCLLWDAQREGVCPAECGTAGNLGSWPGHCHSLSEGLAPRSSGTRTAPARPGCGRTLPSVALQSSDVWCDYKNSFTSGTSRGAGSSPGLWLHLENHHFGKDTHSFPFVTQTQK